MSIENKASDEPAKGETAVAAQQIAGTFNLLKQADGPKLSIDEINRAISDGWAGKPQTA